MWFFTHGLYWDILYFILKSRILIFQYTTLPSCIPFALTGNVSCTYCNVKLSDCQRHNIYYYTSWKNQLFSLDKRYLLILTNTSLTPPTWHYHPLLLTAVDNVENYYPPSIATGDNVKNIAHRQTYPSMTYFVFMTSRFRRCNRKV